MLCVLSVFGIVRHIWVYRCLDWNNYIKIVISAFATASASGALYTALAAALSYYQYGAIEAYLPKDVSSVSLLIAGSLGGWIGLSAAVRNYWNSCIALRQNQKGREGPKKGGRESEMAE